MFLFSANFDTILRVKPHRREKPNPLIEEYWRVLHGYLEKLEYFEGLEKLEYSAKKDPHPHRMFQLVMQQLHWSCVYCINNILQNLLSIPDENQDLGYRVLCCTT